jgi:acyl-coenzyme A synthetase/AMP-(fatty) acid ligase
LPAVPLANLLATDRPADAEIAWRRDERHSWSDFLDQVTAVARHTSGGRWLLDVGDPYAFAVGLFGLARAEAQVVVPANRQLGSLREGLRGCDGAVAEPGFAAAEWAERLVDPQGIEPEAHRPVALDADRPFLSLFTSGTTGAAKEIPKSLAQLDEVRALESAFGSSLPDDTRVFASAPPQHLYGLLFRVLWPLATGRPFHAHTYLHPEELLPALDGCEHAVLAATPTHLRRLAGRPELPALRGRLLGVYSSGGPLDADTAASLAADLGQPPVEIFGSTETGGVAFRSQGTAGPLTPWQPLPEVEAARDAASGRLCVTSPFVSVGSAAGDARSLTFTMEDRVELEPGGGFLLQARADRVVKVAEKRLSLPEMESRLREHPHVSEAALLLLEQGGESRVAAVVVTSPAGAEALASDGRRPVMRGLARHLEPWWDRVLLPRSWRFVPELPRDARGKTPLAALRRLFDGPGERPREPWILDEVREARRIRRTLAVPGDLAQLEGHFEGFPVVPGVVQLGWALAAAAELIGGYPTPRQIEALKFATMLRPGDRAVLEVETNEDGARVSFVLRDPRDASRNFSSGRLTLEPAP